MSLVTVVWLFLAVSWVCLQFVIVFFPDHTHLLLRIVHGMALTNVLLFGATIILQLTHLYARVNINFQKLTYMQKSTLSHSQVLFAFGTTLIFVLWCLRIQGHVQLQYILC